ncbi:mitogen-activated protein kinase kinase kinase 1 [Ipomoea triloba]|uniref:mitogen-activated protein kinase kinase kinase 1 n=1 Tax=Ipomoea triloba TaxID=35885 RepID=UPI00125DAC70|nr:mitogen-activated protein kinase kinase kinase 1 [Ipomoea triloba]
MESVASSSSPAEPPRRRAITHAQPLADRIVRAVSHPLSLLHRSDTLFFVLGATGNVYTVNIAATPSCTCPDRTAPCKHILFVMIRVLGINLDDSCLLRRTLRPCQVNRMLGMPISTDVLAGAEVREKFHQLFFRERAEAASRAAAVEIPEGAACPVCLEEIGREERVAACGTCKNPIHEDCLMAWRRSNRPRRFISCVLCRARWRDVRAAAEQEKYLNLSAYNHVSEDHDMLEGERRCGD